MSDFPFLATLSLVTLVAVVGIGFWQIRSVRRSQARRGEQPGNLTHHNLSADSDFVAPHARTLDEKAEVAARVRHPVGEAATAASERPAA